MLKTRELSLIVSIFMKIRQLFTHFWIARGASFDKGDTVWGAVGSFSLISGGAQITGSWCYSLSLSLSLLNVSK